MVAVGLCELVLVTVGVKLTVPTGLNTGTSTWFEEPYDVFPVFAMNL